MQTRNFITFLLFSSARVQFFPASHPISREQSCVVFPSADLRGRGEVCVCVGRGGVNRRYQMVSEAFIYFTLYFIMDSLCPLTRG